MHDPNLCVASVSAYLDCMLPGIQVTAGLAAFIWCSYSCLGYCEDCDSLAALTSLAFFAGPYWDSV